MHPKVVHRISYVSVCLTTGRTSHARVSRRIDCCAVSARFATLRRGLAGGARRSVSVQVRRGHAAAIARMRRSDIFGDRDARQQRRQHKRPRRPRTWQHPATTQTGRATRWREGTVETREAVAEGAGESVGQGCDERGGRSAPKPRIRSRTLISGGAREHPRAPFSGGRVCRRAVWQLSSDSVHIAKERSQLARYEYAPRHVVEARYLR